jgi:hypothetical protein
MIHSNAGLDVEYGDYDNDGRFQVIVEFPDGSRLIHERIALTEEQARKLSVKVREADSINEDYWGYFYPRYGSQASQMEEYEAAEYATSIRNGHINESDVPYPISTLI